MTIVVVPSDMERVDAGQLLGFLKSWREQQQSKDQEQSGPSYEKPETQIPSVLRLYDQQQQPQNCSIYPYDKTVMELYQTTHDLWVNLGKHLSNEVERLYWVATTTKPDSNSSSTISSSSSDSEESARLGFKEQFMNFHGRIYQVTWDLQDFMPSLLDREDQPKEFMEYKRRFCIAIVGKIKKQLEKCYECTTEIKFDPEKSTIMKRCFEKWFNKMWDVWWEDTQWYAKRMYVGVRHSGGEKWTWGNEKIINHCWKLLEINQLAGLHYCLICHFDVNKLPDKNMWPLLSTWKDSLFQTLTPFIEEVHGKNWLMFPYNMYNHSTYMAGTQMEGDVDIKERNSQLSMFDNYFLPFFDSSMFDMWKRNKVSQMVSEDEYEPPEAQVVESPTVLTPNQKRIKARKQAAARKKAQEERESNGQVQMDEVKEKGGLKDLTEHLDVVQQFQKALDELKKKSENNGPAQISDMMNEIKENGVLKQNEENGGHVQEEQVKYDMRGDMKGKAVLKESCDDAEPFGAQMAEISNLTRQFQNTLGKSTTDSANKSDENTEPSQEAAKKRKKSKKGKGKGKGKKDNTKEDKSGVYQPGSSKRHQNTYVSSSTSNERSEHFVGIMNDTGLHGLGIRNLKRSRNGTVRDSGFSDPDYADR